MAAAWQDWQQVETFDNFLNPEGEAATRQLTPYVHWSTFGPGEDDIDTAARNARTENKSVLELQGFVRAGDAINQPWFDDFEGLQDPLPIPRHASSGVDLAPHTLPHPDDLPVIDDPDTVIAGVIDVGIPLGQWRTRLGTGDAVGKTRILSAWQMLGRYNHGGSNVPFGRELLQSEINALLEEHSAGNIAGKLNQEAFNEATDGVVLDQLSGPADLAGRVSHGAHVLDTAVGDDPFDPSVMGEKVKIIAVNAPSATTFGAGGTYLEQFLFHAIARIVMIADAIWLKNFGGAGVTPPDRKGFEIVINMAFGRQAGARRDFDSFRKALKTFAQARRGAIDGGDPWKRVHFIMPVGNDNLTQSNAFLEPMGGQSETLDWHIPPQDQSSNFTLISAVDHADPMPVLSANLSGPQGFAPLAPPPNIRNVTYFSDLRDGATLLARAYVERVRTDNLGNRIDDATTMTRMDVGDEVRHWLVYTFCVAPTFRPTPSRNRLADLLPEQPEFKPLGTAGNWKLWVTNHTTRQQTSTLTIQTDQGLSPYRTVNRRSFFEHRNYQRYDTMGQPMDSYTYPRSPTDPVVNQDIATKTPIRRHGTMLATAAHGSVTRIAGFRDADGRAAFYSSTGRGRSNGSDDGTDLGSNDNGGTKKAPNAAFPTEDSPALFGILGAGASDGSCTGMRGTSFATPQATRVVLLDILDDPHAPEGRSARHRLNDLAQAREIGRRVGGDPLKLLLTQQNALAEVIGRGRLDYPFERKVKRR